MMVTDKEAKKAADVLAKYCKEHNGCYCCSFVLDTDLNCPLAKLPERWNLK